MRRLQLANKRVQDADSEKHKDDYGQKANAYEIMLRTGLIKNSTHLLDKLVSAQEQSKVELNISENDSVDLSSSLDKKSSPVNKLRNTF